MTKFSKIPLDHIFVSQSVPSFADLITQLETNEAIPTGRRKDLASGLRRVANALALNPVQVPADPQWLQPRIARIAPAAIGVAAKTWHNTVSNARNAMVACGIVRKRHRQTSELIPEWRTLWERIRASKDKSLLSPLPRFIFFLNRIGVHPEEVCSDHARLYLEAVELNEISKDPRNACKDAVMGWNRAVDRLDVWPRQRLAMQSQTRRVMLAEGDYTPGFLSDIDRYLEMRMRPDLLSDNEFLSPITASSAATYRYMLLRFASHLAAAGFPADQLCSLKDLLQPEHVERGLRRMVERNVGNRCASISDTAGLLLTIATHLDLPAETRSRLAQFKARLLIRAPDGMTAKNRERLRALRAPGVLARLVQLPEQIIARPFDGYRSLLAREDAIAIGILLYCPLRIGNLSALEIDRHIHRPGRRQMFLVIPANEVKNNRPLEFELPPHLTAMIDAHLASRAPLLCPPDCPFLFPARRKKDPVAASGLSERIRKRLWDEIGVEMNAHLFRHLAVMIYLDKNPGGYEVARQMLGHSSVSRTISVYSGLETISATQAFAAAVNELRGGA